jgi:iron complex outermembrane receptor protein
MTPSQLRRASRTVTIHSRYHPAGAIAVLAVLADFLMLQTVCAAEALPFDIPAGEAVAALRLFHSQAHSQLLFDMETVRGQVTHAVIGKYEPQAALALLLEGTSLTFDYVDGQTVLILSRAALRGPRQADGAGTTQRGREPATVDHDSSEAAEPIVVLGNQDPSSALGAQQITLDREDIARTGFTTIQEVIGALPQNFGGGPSDDIRANGPETPTNTGKGGSLNLRGVGAHSTVTLINGRRIAPSGSEGAFVDVSNIPLTAVAHIDVLPEGGSVPYGSDGLGVVNIQLRDRYDGAETLATMGSALGGALREYQVEQALGSVWDRGDGLLSFEYYQRDALPSSVRWQGNSDLRAHGGSDFDTTYSNPGNIIVGAQTWAIPDGQDGRALTAASLKPGTRNLETLLNGADLIAGQRRASVAASAHHAWGDDAFWFIDLLATERHAQQRSPGVRLALTVPNSNPFYFNPAGGTAPVVVTYDFLDDLGPSIADLLVRTLNVAAGETLDVGKWHLQLYDAFALETEKVHQRGLVDRLALALALADPNPARAFNPFGAGSHTNSATLAGLRSESLFRSNSGLASCNLVADGPLFTTSAGATTLAVGIDHRAQYFDSLSSEPPDVPQAGAFHRRNVTSGFGKVVLPLFRRETPWQDVTAADLTAGVRTEKYTDIGWIMTQNQQLRWRLTPGLTLRGAWGTYASAPHLADMDEHDNGTVLLSLPDPTALSGWTSALVWFGKNRDLHAERASTRSVGADVKPEHFPGLTFSATYFDVNAKDRIQDIAFTEDILSNRAYSEVVVRQPAPSLRAAVCGRSTFIGPPGDCSKAPIGALVDFRIRNSATLTTRGIDVAVRDRRESRLGVFDTSLSGTYLFQYTQADTHAAAPVDLLNTQNNPIALRLRGSLSWQHRAVDSTVFLNYAGSYRDVVSRPNRTVASWTTTDLQLNYAMHTAGPQRSVFSVSVVNLFNQAPPFLNNVLGIGYDAENADLLGRFVRISIKRDW